MPRRSASPFTPQERDLIRLELMPRFGQDPDLANGLFLRTWRDGPQKGQPKVPKAIQTMLNRGLVPLHRGFDRLRFQAPTGQKPDFPATMASTISLRSGGQQGRRTRQNLCDEVLVAIGTNPMGRPAAFFIEAGFEGLRQLLEDRRMMDPGRFDHLRRALGVDGPSAEKG